MDKATYFVLCFLLVLVACQTSEVEAVDEEEIRKIFSSRIFSILPTVKNIMV
jgi:hypothetical protein